MLPQAPDDGTRQWVPVKYRRTVYALLVLTVIYGVTFCVAAVVHLKRQSEQDAAIELRRAAERDRIVDAIRAFHGQHGRLPKSLEEAGATIDSQLFTTVTYGHPWQKQDEFYLICYPPWPFIGEKPSWHFDSKAGLWERRVSQSD